MERAEQRIWKGNISRWQARNLELYRQQIVCKSVCSSERVWEGYGRDTLIPIGLSVEGGRGGEEITWWHAVVRQECWMMAAR